MDKQEKKMISEAEGIMSSYKGHFDFSFRLEKHMLRCSRWMFSEAHWYLRLAIPRILWYTVTFQLWSAVYAARWFFIHRRRFKLTSPKRYYEKKLMKHTKRKITAMARFAGSNRTKYLANSEEHIIECQRCIDGIQEELERR